MSRLNPSVTEEDIRDYITTNTSASSNFNVRKLVKRGQDLTQLNFVSFKVDVNAADFDILKVQSAWPVGVAVRPWDPVPMAKPVTLGNFFPENLNGLQPRTSPSKSKLNTTNGMVVVEDSPTKSNVS